MGGIQFHSNGLVESLLCHDIHDFIKIHSLSHFPLALLQFFHVDNRSSTITHDCNMCYQVKSMFRYFLGRKFSEISGFELNSYRKALGRCFGLLLCTLCISITLELIFLRQDGIAVTSYMWIFTPLLIVWTCGFLYLCFFACSSFFFFMIGIHTGSTIRNIDFV